ncbi:hypothetical protein SAMN05216251_12013 [Actinacidiphila alni]|uniref:Uncharacterized protein n=1 Tax=Actinacidiphila alni TaxID=380248 RepID=A0A1I2JZC0_9ACTN|nr:hypothetical protein SAMN05216251_12013 [Actinacidiphila alni]
MGGRRSFADRERLAGVARAALGPRRRITEVARLRGGSKKGVYRLTLDDGASVIVYIWDSAENYWPASPQGGPIRRARRRSCTANSAPTTSWWTTGAGRC